MPLSREQRWRMSSVTCCSMFIVNGLCELTMVLQTRPAVGGEGKKVGDADVDVAVERSKKPPTSEGRGCEGWNNSARAGYAVTRW